MQRRRFRSHWPARRQTPIASSSRASGSRATTTRATPSCSRACRGSTATWRSPPTGASRARLQYRAFTWSAAVALPRRVRAREPALPHDVHGRQRADPLLRRSRRRRRRRSLVHAGRRGAAARPNLKAYVVTAERAARRYEELGVDKPYHVIPQGVSLSSLTDEQVAEPRRPGARPARSSSAGWPRTCSPPATATATGRSTTSTTCSSSGTRCTRGSRRGGSGSSAARASACGKRVAGRRRHRPLRPAAARAGPRGRGELRPRRLPAHAGHGHPGGQGRRVHRPRRADRLLRLRGDGEPPRDRARACSCRRRASSSTRSSGSAEDEAARAELAAAARRAGAALDWDVLARRYEEEILDRYLPPSG